jgi:DUF4097 and DUF4098 domain-containing protein YvlB
MVHHFDTPNPPRLAIDLRAGAITIDTSETTQTVVDVVAMNDAKVTMEAVAATTVEQHGDDIVVNVPHRFIGFGLRSANLAVRVTAPDGTHLGVKTGSADLVATGRFGTTSVDTGSGDVTIGDVSDSVRVNSGSGDVRIRAVDRDATVRTGSGDIDVAAVAGAASFSTGSGDMHLGDGGRALDVKSGSGNVTVGTAPSDVQIVTASGDTRIDAVDQGEVRVRASSGDISTGVRAGTAAWLDVKTVSGRVASGLDSGGGEPAADERTARLQLRTTSGNISLVRV